MKLAVGLGNPGAKYARHRHNVGFMVLEVLWRRLAAGSPKTRFSGEFAKATLEGEPVALLRPLTYMNRSGRSVAECASFFKVAMADTLVVHDELDLPFGRLRLKMGGGAAGHNGLRSIMESCGSADFGRLRFGIGRPTLGRPHDYVLSEFDQDEQAELPRLLERAADAVVAALTTGFAAAMNDFNR